MIECQTRFFAASPSVGSDANSQLPLPLHDHRMPEQAIDVVSIEKVDEALIEAFVLSHPEHGPGNRRALAAVERALGHREVSQIALRSGRVIGVAPAFAIHSRVLRLLQTTRVAGGSLVAAGPLVCADLPEKQAGPVFRALFDAVQRAAAQAGALEFGWVLPPIAGARSTITAHRPLPLLAFGAQLGHVPGPVVDLSLSEDELLASLSATTRTRIRRSRDERIEIRVPTSAAERVQSLEPFRSSASTAFAGVGEPERAFDAVVAHLLASSAVHDTIAKPVAHPVVIVKDGEPISAVVTCESNGAAYYLLAFNTEAGRAADGNRLALWHAMLQARSRGVRWFQLGSLDFGSGKAASISAFKRQFGGIILLAPTLTWPVRPVADAALTFLQTMVTSARVSLRRAAKIR